MNRERIQAEPAEKKHTATAHGSFGRFVHKFANDLLYLRGRIKNISYRAGKAYNEFIERWG